MIVLNLISLEVQFELFFNKKLGKNTGIYRYADDGIPVFAIPILFIFIQLIWTLSFVF